MPAPPLVKICGVTSLDDVRAALLAGGDWIGLNFHPTSPRRISQELAGEILADFGESATFVGVFVDRPVDEVAKLAHGIGLRVVQLHGSEPDSDVIELRSTGLRVIRAARIGRLEDIDDLLASLDRSHSEGSVADYLLLDAFVPGRPGGTGVAIGEDLLRALPISDGAVEFGVGRRILLILAGGLNPRNVADRVARANPWMVDVASGVESAPGRKDAAAMAAFVLAARSR